MPVKRGFSDLDWSCASAVGLTAAAAVIVLVLHPGGFEGQVAWFFGLFPGAVVSYYLADRAYDVLHGQDPILMWIAVIGISFLWYFLVSWFVIRAVRLIRRVLLPERTRFY